MSEASEVRLFIGWNFFSAEMYYQFGHLDTSVPGNVTVFLPQRWYVTTYYGG